MILCYLLTLFCNYGNCFLFSSPPHLLPHGPSRKGGHKLWQGFDDRSVVFANRECSLPCCALAYIRLCVCPFVCFPTSFPCLPVGQWWLRFWVFLFLYTKRCPPLVIAPFTPSFSHPLRSVVRVFWFTFPPKRGWLFWSVTSPPPLSMFTRLVPETCEPFITGLCVCQTFHLFSVCVPLFLFFSTVRLFSVPGKCQERWIPPMSSVSPRVIAFFM